MATAASLPTDTHRGEHMHAGNALDHNAAGFCHPAQVLLSKTGVLYGGQSPRLKILGPGVLESFAICCSGYQDVFLLCESECERFKSEKIILMIENTYFLLYVISSMLICSKCPWFYLSYAKISIIW